MDDNRSEWYSIAVGILCFLAFILLFFALKRELQSAEAAIKLPLLVVVGVMALFATLALVALTFSVAGLSDKSQALGLPEGSVRAAIALSLIVIFAILSIYLYGNIAASSSENKESTDFAKQVFAVVGTLMTSVASFYFASRAASITAAAPSSTPSLVSIEPAQAVKGTAAVVVPVKISGTGLQLAKTVKFGMSGANALLANDVVSNDQAVRCEVSIDPGLAPGKYDVIVTNSDGREAKLPSAFEILAEMPPADGGR